MFSILKKASFALAAFVNDLLDRSVDAGRAGRQAVRVVEGQIRQAEESVTDVDAELRLMKHEADKADEAAVKWGQVAQKAAEQGDGQAAIEAIQQQVQAEELTQSYRGHVTRLAPMLDQLKARLSQLRLKKQELQHKTSVLDARSKVAKAESRAARYLGNVGATPGVDFNTIEQQVDRDEAKAAALVDLVAEKGQLDPTQRLANHARRDAIDSKLQALGLAGHQATIASGGNNA